MLDGLQRGILRKNRILEKTKRKQRETNYSLEKNINIKINEQMSQRNCIIYTIKCFVWWFMRDMKVSILQKKYKTPDWWLMFIFLQWLLVTISFYTLFSFQSLLQCDCCWTLHSRHRWQPSTSKPQSHRKNPGQHRAAVQLGHSENNQIYPILTVASEWKLPVPRIPCQLLPVPPSARILFSVKSLVWSQSCFQKIHAWALLFAFWVSALLIAFQPN